MVLKEIDQILILKHKDEDHLNLEKEIDIIKLKEGVKEIIKKIIKKIIINNRIHQNNEDAVIEVVVAEIEVEVHIENVVQIEDVVRIEDEVKIEDAVEEIIMIEI